MRLATLKLGDVLNLYNGKAPELSDDGDVTVFGSNGVIGRSQKFNHPSSVILGRVGAYCGAVKFSDDPFWASDNTIVVRPVEGHDLKYWYYKLQSIPLRSYAGGAAQPLITHSIIKPIETKVHPNIEEQRRIASILSAYDDLVENNRRRIALLEEAARLLYREWFVHFRFPGHEHVNIVDGIPEGWSVLPASEAVEINPRTDWDKDKPITMVPMAALSETGMIIDSSCFEERPKATGVRFQNGDTLLARITPCLENGKTGFVDSLTSSQVACGSTEFIVLREKRVSRYFVYLMAREDSFRDNAIVSMVGSSGRQRVQPSCFDKYSVPIPTNPIADAFDEIVGPIFDQISVLRGNTAKLVEARDLLLPRLLDGRLEVAA